MSKRFPTPIDAAVSEARDRMATMQPGDVIQVPVNGGKYSAHRVTATVRYYGTQLWGKGCCQAMHRGLTGLVAVTRLEERAR